MANDYTQLNQGSGGDVMDETGVTYPSSPITRKRPRVVLSGQGLTEFAVVKDTDAINSDMGLVTRPMPSAIAHPGDPISQYVSTSLVPYNTETTIGTYIVPTGYTFYVTGFAASGDINGRYILYLNGTVKLQARSTPAYLNVCVNMGIVRPTVLEGNPVRLSVIHNQNGLQANFDGTILGYIVPN